MRPLEHEGQVTSLFFSPDDKWLATRTAKNCNRYEGLVVRTTTRVWDLQTGSEVGWVSEEDTCHKKPPLPRAASGGQTELALAAATWQPAFDVRTKAADDLESRDGSWEAELG